MTWTDRDKLKELLKVLMSGNYNRKLNQEQMRQAMVILIEYVLSETME